MEKEDLVMAMKSLVDDFNTFITKLNSDDHATNGSSIATAGVSQSVHNIKVSSSFASILQNKPLSKVVKITEMRNKEVVEGAAVAIPFDAEGIEKVLEARPWLIRLVPLILNKWSPNADLKKAEVKTAPVWVKLHHVPIVAYSEVGLSLIMTQIGRPIMLDSYTSNMCLKSWGRSTYARALIEVHADQDLKESIVISIPLGPEKEVSIKAVDNDGFVEVKRKKNKAKQSAQSRMINGVSDMPTSTERVDVVVPKPKVTLKNSFSSLGMDDMDVEQTPEVGKDSEHVLNVSDSEVDEEIILDDRNGKCIPDIT
ncbi:zinc knuckle CX2CX4HX4C containing protein [Tanacetum coccineum]|uniref:Zinc knuckle CX2CX4HX4C containing protein n=1 Tax=Tanacetum coccineum TaxID=301880 RepID=A0ABQ5CNY8_9ASTR